MKRIGMLSLLCAGVLTGACNRADHDMSSAAGRAEAVGTSGAGEATANANARQFVMDMLAGNAAEIQVARLAAERARNAEVKRYALMLAQDHTKALDQLKKMAAAYRIQGPTSLDDDHNELMAKLSKVEPADFDGEYMKAMVDDHEHAIDHLEDRANELKPRGASGSATPMGAGDTLESRVNHWAATVLPTVRGHLDRAKEIKDHLNE